MKRSSSLWRLSLFALLAFFALLSSDAHAQIQFVQISDPHLFDDISADVDNRSSNKTAFISSIEEINRRLIENKAQYRFVVLTGDLGLEKLVTGAKDRNEIETNLRNSAAEFASMLVLSRVHHWLFVPGNNDLLNEEPKTIEYYHFFIEAVKEATKKIISDFEIKDLCPKGDGGSADYQSKSDFFKIDKYVFIGFDDSSFKNDIKQGPQRLDANAGIQEKYVKQVKAHLDRDDISYAYIFYHVPAIDDPNPLPEAEAVKARSLLKDQIGDSFFRSAWFVKSPVRMAWHTVVINRKVRGLFAGHFHDSRKQTYQTFSWLTPDYLPEEIEKLHICPPLALKYQNGKPEQARGFQEVYLDEEGTVSARIVWFNSWNLSSVQKSADESAMEQFELGQTLERLNRPTEAQAAYAKAAESDWPPTRRMAQESLTQLINSQETWRHKYFWSPFSVGANALWTAFISAVLLLVIAAVATLLIRPFAKRYGRQRVKIGPVTDVRNGNAGLRFEQVAPGVLGVIRNRFTQNPPPLFRNNLILPILAKSQSPEVKELIEAAAPGSFGKLFVWIYTRFHRPRYSIQGLADSNIDNHYLFISLNDRGDTVKEWEYEHPLNSLAAEKNVALRVLLRLVEYMNR
jgi:hypothetical protein